MDLTSAARRLYGVAPEEFTAARRELVELARKDGDAALAKRVGALRRPTMSAWAVNLLSRDAAPELQMLLDTGSDLRAAWAEGRPIGGLEQRRGELVDLLVRAARRLADQAGRPLRDPAVREVEDTLLAATVDPGAADEVGGGALTRPLSHTGFVPAGFAPAASPAPAATPATKRAAAPRTTPNHNPSAARQKTQVTGKRTERARQRAETAKQAEEADQRAAKAERLLESREAEAEAARRELDEAEAGVERLRADLEAAERHSDRLQRRAERAERRRAQAADAAARARTKADEYG
ncbi:hypothetical protein [Actinomadura oligospora]|uniref:hypothetical protein n=1 Tax=Actinomadura oligospora TaxID=111804 RepID=UPI0004B1AFE1|nr:hypothetical protein [Actinomadura oligospora]